METEYIKEFVVLADCMSFSTASNILFISQSSLSKHIKTLERELGITLFDRTTRSIRLTEAGRTFLVYATDIASLYDKAVIAIDEIKSDTAGTLLVATMQNPQYYDLAKYIVSFRDEHPEITFKMLEADEFSLYDMFKNGVINVFPTYELFRSEPEDYKFLPMVRSRIDAIMHIDNPLARKSHISLADLHNEKLLLPARGTTLSKLIQREFSKARITPNIVYEGSSTGSVELIKADVGVALHAEEFSRNVAKNERLVAKPLEPAIEFVYGAAYRDPSTMKRAEQIYLSHLKKFELK